MEETGLYITLSNSNFFLVSIEKDDVHDKYSVKIKPVERSVEDPLLLDDDTCLVISIFSVGGKLKGEIDMLIFNRHCSLWNDLHRGDGTKSMLMSTMSICRELFQVTDFDLVDVSEFNCEISKLDVNLSFHNLLVHGESWYERKFGASPVNDNDFLKWEESKVTLRGLVTRDILMGINRKTNFLLRKSEHKENRLRFSRIMNQSLGVKTWNEMFSEINAHPEGCLFFSPRMMYLLGMSFNIPDIDTWVIKISDDDVVQNLESYKKIESIDMLGTFTNF